MDEYSFTKSDFQKISSYAHNLFINRGIKHKEGYDGFLTECFVEAIKWYCSAKGLIIKDGKIFKIQSETEQETDKPPMS